MKKESPGFRPGLIQNMQRSSVSRFQHGLAYLHIAENHPADLIDPTWGLSEITKKET